LSREKATDNVGGSLLSGREFMAEFDVVLENVCKKFGDFYAVKDFNIKINKGEYIAFLGPSGCGKTTTLRMIAGHEEATEGSIYIRDQLVNDFPPVMRNTSLMFQNFALFPHMNVWKNVEFGLEMRRIAPEERRKRVSATLERVQLRDLAERKPAELSGGQQQRVALARALVTEPAVLLLDEPLGSLDELLRIKIRGDLKNLQRKLGITFIHVTHNQDECLTMGDRLVVMNGGIIEQIGTPQEVYIRPQTFFVASFVGDNFILEGEITSANGTLVTIQTKRGPFKVETERPLPSKGERTGFSIRADLISTLRGGGSGTYENQLVGVVDFVEYVGYIVKLRVKLEDGNEVIVKETQDTYFQKPFRERDKVTLGWNAKDAVLLTGGT
jgi:ABC-type Fe3+/spermidine/putrescine transport system ATPase subunit